MASAQDRLFEVFLQIAGDQSSGSASPVELAGRELASSLKDVVRQISAVSLPPQGTAVTSVASTVSSGGGVVDVLEAVGSSVLKNGLGAAPLVRGLLSLFGGGESESEALPPLAKHLLPPSIQFRAADTADGFRGVDYDQFGLPRVVRPSAETVAPERRETTQQVTVNVQAMDARSFLDRSGDIAAAVREAMLNLNSINDVVSDL